MSQLILSEKENPMENLKKVAKKDPQVMQVLMDFHHVLSIVGKFSEQSTGENFDEFLKCDGIGNFVLNHDPLTLDLFLERWSRWRSNPAENC